MALEKSAPVVRSHQLTMRNTIRHDLYRRNLVTVVTTEGELVWTFITDSFNPSNERKTIEQLVKVVASQMKGKGIL